MEVCRAGPNEQRVRDTEEEYSTVDSSPHSMKGSECCFVNKITGASTVAPFIRPPSREFS